MKKVPIVVPNSVRRKPKAVVHVETVRVCINAIRFVFFEADVRSFEIRITVCDVSVSRISDTPFYGFPQTVL